MKNFREGGYGTSGMASFGAAALLAVTAATAQVAGGTTGLDTSGNYQQEVQACNAGKTAEDRATCLKEARNAQADRRRGVLNNASNDFATNARARCNALQGEDKAACEARMSGFGEISGSVAGGGILREVETVVMPPGQGEVSVQPKTPDPVVLVPQR